MIVDDEMTLARALSRALPGIWTITIETDSRKARERLLEKKEDFDVVLLDLMIPHLSGMVLFTEIAQERPSVCACVIFITGGLYIPAVQEFLKSVPDHMVIEKPFMPSEIVDAVLRLTGHDNGPRKP